MSNPATNQPDLPRDLGNGLVLRRSTPDDADRLAEFNSRIHGGEKPDPCVGAWTRDLLTGAHPTFAAGDFLIVERSADGKIVSSTNLISQTWAYNGIPFKVGRPELVGTDPEYRRRGLVRQQMDILHTWSEARGEPVQVITGIPNYYRQFGYEMTVDLECGRYVHYQQFKPMAADKSEPYALRPAGVDDIPVLKQAYESSESQNALTCLRSETDWVYELTGKNPQNMDRVDLYIIDDEGKKPVGAVGVKSILQSDSLVVQFYGLLPGNSTLMVTPSVLRFLWRLGQAKMETGKTCTRLILLFGEHHPAYPALDPRVTSPINPYAFYMRVPDLPRFLRHITPVLEKRLAESSCAGHTGELKLSFYRGGICLKFEKGYIAEISPFVPKDWEDGDAAFPEQTFIQLLFQSRSLDELGYAYTDCLATTEGKALLNALFPRSPSAVWVMS